METTEMNYIVVCEDLYGEYQSPLMMCATLEEAREWLRENEPEFADYVIYKVKIERL